MQKKRDDRSRSWTLVLYPDSVPKSWRDLLDATRIAWVESPLHDKDLNPDGTPKKPHWHIILLYGSKKAYSQVLEVAELLHAPIPQKVQNLKGAVRYLVHTDNPEKYQYSRSDIVCHGGAEVDSFFELSSESKERVLWEVMQFIRDEKVTSYSELIGFCQETDNWEWFRIATRYYTLAIRTLIDSVYQDQKEPKTVGDIISDNVRKTKEMAEKGYSIRQIADTLGLGKSTIQRYLKN